VEFLTKRIADIDRIMTLGSDDPEVRKWKATTAGILDATFGKPNGGLREMKKTSTARVLIRCCRLRIRATRPNRPILNDPDS
jgi:hypothetical protein